MVGGTKSKKRKAAEAAAEAETNADSSDGASGAKDSRHRPGVLSKDLLKGLQDPDRFCDIILVGSDEGRVPAIRSILAMRSPVLDRMLLGSFQEALSDEIRLDFPSDVLRSAVEWCMSDTVDSFVEFQDMVKGGEEGGGAPPEKENEEIIATLQTLVETAACAHYLELKSLQDWLEVMLGELVIENFAFALTVWDSAAKCGAGIETICASALDIVLENHKTCFGLEPSASENFLQALSAEGLEALVQNTSFIPHALDIFHAVYKWSNGSDGSDQKTRREKARACAAQIDLLWIPPKLLVSVVRASGLFEQERILDAAAEHAVNAGPHSVYIVGAGSSFGNGIYKMAAYKVNDWPVYEMKVEQEGKEITIGVCRSGDTLFISSPGEGKDQVDGTKKDIDFYMSSDDVHVCGGFVSGLSWTVLDKGEAPPPKFFVSPTWDT